MNAPCDDNKKALSRAVFWLSKKGYSEQEIYLKLLAKEFSPQSAAYAVSRLLEIHVLDDQAYGQSLAAHYYNRGYGRARVRQVLLQHKIPRELIDEITREQPDFSSEIRAFLQKKLSNTDLADRKSVSRAVNALLRRGFSYADISPILHEFREDENFFE